MRGKVGGHVGAIGGDEHTRSNNVGPGHTLAERWVGLYRMRADQAGRACDRPVTLVLVQGLPGILKLVHRSNTFLVKTRSLPTPALDVSDAAPTDQSWTKRKGFHLVPAACDTSSLPTCQK